MKITRRFGKNQEYRSKLMKHLTTSLVRHDQIRTTVAKAKEMRRFADRVVILAKEGTMHSRKQAAKLITDKEVLQKLFGEFPKRFKYRQHGFTRVRKCMFRPGDGADMAIIEYIRDDLTMTPADFGVVVSDIGTVTSNNQTETEKVTNRVKEDL